MEMKKRRCNDVLNLVSIKRIILKSMTIEMRHKMENTISILENLKRETQKDESEIISMAFKTGLKHLWPELILGKYLRGKVSRDETIEIVGIDWVELAERQKKAMMEDLESALKK